MARNTQASSEPTDETSEELRAPAFVGVKYVGHADEKLLTAVDRLMLGDEDAEGDLRWNSQNDHTVAASELSGPTLEYLRSQPDFRAIYE